MAASYQFDERVEDLLRTFAAAVLAGARAAGGEDCVEALGRLEALRVAASYKAAGVASGDPPLCDPAGIAAVSAMWQAVTDDLGDEGWERLVAEWRRR